MQRRSKLIHLKSQRKIPNLQLKSFSQNLNNLNLKAKVNRMLKSQIKAKVKNVQSRWRIWPVIHRHNRKRKQQKDNLILPSPPKQEDMILRHPPKGKVLRVKACKRMPMPQQRQVKRAIKDPRMVLVRLRELLPMETRKLRLKQGGKINRVIQNKVRNQINKVQCNQRRAQPNKANLHRQLKKREESLKRCLMRECKEGWGWILMKKHQWKVRRTL